MKILIVEDSRSSHLLLTQHVERFGATAHCASSGSDALALYAQIHPDLVLLDVVLPDMDGFMVAQRIRAMENPGDWIPIIFLSSQSDDANIEKGIAAGGDDYLLTPVSEIVLGAKIRAMQRIALMRSSLIGLTRKLDAANQELVRISSTDALTGISNRRFFEEAISVEWRRARRHSNSIALMMCDIDYFKLFNDTHGQQAGDECLRKVATAIRQNTERPSDIVARHASSPGGAVTLSIGIASAAPGFDNPPDDLIQAADKALYRAKREGRDRICRADET